MHFASDPLDGGGTIPLRDASLVPEMTWSHFFLVARTKHTVSETRAKMAKPMTAYKRYILRVSCADEDERRRRREREDADVTRCVNEVREKGVESGKKILCRQCQFGQGLK